MVAWTGLAYTVDHRRHVYLVEALARQTPGSYLKASEFIRRGLHHEGSYSPIIDHPGACLESGRRNNGGVQPNKNIRWQLE